MIGDMDMKKIKNYDILFLFLFISVLIFLIFKAKYGYIYNDEPTLLSYGYRLSLGDRLLVDDYSVMQLIGFLSYPFLKLYTMFNSDTQGILLYGRYCYLFLWTITNLFAYYRLRKYKIGAALGIASLYMFAPVDMMTLSYNSFCLMGLVVSSAIAVTCKNNKEYILIGLFFAVSVLSIPYMIAVYLGFTLYALFNYRKNKIIYNNIKLNEAWLYFTIGAGILLVLFVIFILSKASINEVLTSIKYILSTNDEHSFRMPIALMSSYLKEFNSRFNILIISAPILFVITYFDTKREKRKFIYLLISFLIYLYTINYLDKNSNTYPNINLTVIPFLVVGIECYLLTVKKDTPLLFFMVVLGIVYSIIFHQGSNLGIVAIGNTFSLVTLASIIFVNIYAREQSNKTLKVLLIGCVFLQLAFQLKLRYEGYYLDRTIDELTYKLEVGPAKGIYTCEGNAEQYNYDYEQIEYLTEGYTNEDIFYYPYSNPWFYLATNMKIGSYSAWGSWGNPIKTHSINEIYYKNNPDKYPTYVLLEKYNDVILDEFIEELLSNGYETFESDDYMLYFKK